MLRHLFKFFSQVFVQLIRLFLLFLLHSRPGEGRSSSSRANDTDTRSSHSIFFSAVSVSVPEVVGLLLGKFSKAFVSLAFRGSMVDHVEMALVHLSGQLSAGYLVKEYSRILALDPASNLINSSKSRFIFQVELSEMLRV